jgi:hypothetical protein
MRNLLEEKMPKEAATSSDISVITMLLATLLITNFSNL